jgi:lysophospholipase L1-like esterase
MRRGGFLRNLLFTMATVALVLVSLEVGVRLADVGPRPVALAPGSEVSLEEIERPDPNLLFRMRPNLDVRLKGIPLRTNSLGLRNEEVVPNKPAGTYRILSLGESSTMGLGVAAEETYTKCLERTLRGTCPERGVEAINAGTFGWNSFQDLAFLRTEGVYLAPDMVLLYVLHNDLTEHVPESFDREYRERMGWKPKKSSPRRFVLTDRGKVSLIHSLQGPLSVLSHSALFRFLSATVAGGFHGGRGSSKHVRVTIDERRENLEEIARFCGEHGARLVLLVPPLPGYHPLRRWLGDCYGQDLRDMAREHADVLLLDLNERLDREDPAAFYLPDNVHPSVYGHRRIGEEIARFLAERAPLCPDAVVTGALPNPPPSEGSSR